MKIPDIPEQYKELTHKQIFKLMDNALILWPIIRELGDSFECENDEIKIIIKGKVSHEKTI